MTNEPGSPRSPRNMAPQYLDPHLDHRKAQERAHFEAVRSSADPMASLVTVEINLTELCNRVCVFCPRVDPAKYPNRNLHMGRATVDKVAADLAAIRSGCRISFSGYGEPLLHEDLPGVIEAFHRHLPDNTLEINTNGDRLTVDGIKVLFDSGLRYLYVNLYDGPEQAETFTAMFDDAGLDPSSWRLRPHWPGSDGGYGLTLNNRSGVLDSAAAEVGPLVQPLVMRCHYPFYKMLVDWNGDVLFCSNDWGREIVVGNVMTSSVRELWLSPEMLEVRRSLMTGDRSHSPCNTCDVHGTLSGGPSFERLIAHYLSTGLITSEEMPADLM